MHASNIANKNFKNRILNILRIRYKHRRNFAKNSTMKFKIFHFIEGTINTNNFYVQL